MQPGAAYAVGADARRTGISNSLLSLEIDQHSGAICSLRYRGIDADLVDANQSSGLNDYLYILGRDPDKNRESPRGPEYITVEDKGRLSQRVMDRVRCSRLYKPGSTRARCRWTGLRRVDQHCRQGQGETPGKAVTLSFSTSPKPHRVSMPPGLSVQVEKDQLPGANRNFYCVQRWVDLSSDDYGVTWVTLDAPMMQFDPIKIAVAQGLNWWRSAIDPNSHIYSWVMNNHWETNYKGRRRKAW